MNDVSVLAMSTAYSILDTMQTWQQGQTEKQKDDRTDDGISLYQSTSPLQVSIRLFRHVYAH